MEHPRAPRFEPCRPAYPELVTFGVPRGWGERLKDLARQQGTSVSALMRRAVERDLVVAQRRPEAAR